jgi:hypothetical protein
MTYALVVWMGLVSLGGDCRVRSPQGQPESKCVADCTKRASSRCSENACIRGCRFVLDRLIEHEGPRVVACVAKQKACNDPVWAQCAVNVGEHADGGPPGPPPPRDPSEDDEEAASSNPDSLD